MDFTIKPSAVAFIKLTSGEELSYYAFKEDTCIQMCSKKEDGSYHVHCTIYDEVRPYDALNEFVKFETKIFKNVQSIRVTECEED